MKNKWLICFGVIYILASLCIYQAIKKEDIYISFEDLKGYKYQFIDSTDISKTREVLITQGGERWYQWWSIEIDTEKIKKADADNIRRIIINSQYFIIHNVQPLKKVDIFEKYQIFIIKLVNDVPYILPVKNIGYVVE